MEKTLFSTPEVAGWLGVFHTTVRRWIERGDINGVRVGRNYKIPIEEVLRVLDSHNIPLPEILSRYKLKQKRDRNNLSPQMGRSSSILQKLLIVEEVDNPALICRRHVVLGANEAFADLVGYSQADLIGIEIAQVMDNSSQERLTNFATGPMQSLGKGTSDYAGYLKTKKSGEKRAKITVGSLDNMKDVFLVTIEVL